MTTTGMSKTLALNPVRAFSWFSFGFAGLTLGAAATGWLLLTAEHALGPLWLDRVAASIPSSRLAVVSSLATLFTRGGEEIVLVAAFLGLILWSRRVGAGSWVRFFTFVGIGGVTLDNVIKPLVGRTRPAFDQLLPGTGPSFPSGHVLGFTALVLSLAYLFSEKRSRGTARMIWIAATVLLLTMGASRVYLGVHWPTDTIAGMWIGALWTWLCYVGTIRHSAEWVVTREMHAIPPTRRGWGLLLPWTSRLRRLGSRLYGIS